MPPKAAAGGGPGQPSRVRVSEKVLTEFTSNLAVLQDAGLPIVRSLKILEGQTKIGPFKTVLTAVHEDVESGTALSDAMAKHPGVFDALYTNMVKAGEAGGILDTILMRLAEFKEKAQRLRGKVKGAMVYPIVVSIVACALLSFIVIFVVPKFEEVFRTIQGPKGQKIELPALTQAVMGFAKWMLPGKDGGWGVVILPGIILLLVLGVKAWCRTTGGRRTVDGLLLRAPLFGPVTKMTLVARFARTLGTLISSGVPILDALDIVKGSLDNVVLQDAIQKVRDSIKEGESMAEPLGKSGIFDDMVVNMIDVGEETGELDKMLVRIADNYDQQVDVRLQALVSILEPTLIVFMGVAVGTIVFAIFMPMLQIIQGL
ncbi:MAG: putative type II secretion system protein F [Planctomycetes bacterium]|nr:putative type II secretion system protein F [Planctomycetota bacterium]